MGTRKELARQYKERDVTGGVYRIVNSVTGKCLLGSAVELSSARNRFDFSVNMNSCTMHELRGDWEAHGPRSFSFEALEEISKKPEQSGADFQEDVRALEEMWREKLDPETLY